MSTIIESFEREKNTEIKVRFHPLKKRFVFKLPSQKRDFQEYHWSKLQTTFACKSCNSSLG
jgi:hypothetical protein